MYRFIFVLTVLLFLATSTSAQALSNQEIPACSATKILTITDIYDQLRTSIADLLDQVTTASSDSERSDTITAARAVQANWWNETRPTLPACADSVALSDIGGQAIDETVITTSLQLIDSTGAEQHKDGVMDLLQLLETIFSREDGLPPIPACTQPQVHTFAGAVRQFHATITETLDQVKNATDRDKPRMVRGVRMSLQGWWIDLDPSLLPYCAIALEASVVMRHISNEIIASAIMISIDRSFSEYLEPIQVQLNEFEMNISTVLDIDFTQMETEIIPANIKPQAGNWSGNLDLGRVLRTSISFTIDNAGDIRNLEIVVEHLATRQTCTLSAGRVDVNIDTFNISFGFLRTDPKLIGTFTGERQLSMTVSAGTFSCGGAFFTVEGTGTATPR